MGKAKNEVKHLNNWLFFLKHLNMFEISKPLVIYFRWE